MRQKPIVLCLSGLDPTGGAGIQADIETLFSLGCHCLPIVSSLTVQDTTDVLASSPVPVELLDAQLNTVTRDITPVAVKLGLIDSPAVLNKIVDLLQQLRARHPDLIIVADPVLKAGGGFEFSTQSLPLLYRQRIVPLCTVITPNTVELQRLCPEASSLAEAARQLCAEGCRNVLLTGTHADTEEVINTLFSASEIPGVEIRTLNSSWPRLPASYHGSGCTLASALTANLAHGMAVTEAALVAQEYTWQALNTAHKPGGGQWLPNRNVTDHTPAPDD